ncbi:hypothetical protein HK102_008278, partial [Quaeritorhiza haematococci]
LADPFNAPPSFLMRSHEKFLALLDNDTITTEPTPCLPTVSTRDNAEGETTFTLTATPGDETYSIGIRITNDYKGALGGLSASGLKPTIVILNPPLQKFLKDSLEASQHESGQKVLIDAYTNNCNTVFGQIHSQMRRIRQDHFIVITFVSDMRLLVPVQRELAAEFSGGCEFVIWARTSRGTQPAEILSSESGPSMFWNAAEFVLVAFSTEEARTECTTIKMGQIPNMVHFDPTLYKHLERPFNSPKPFNLFEKPDMLLKWILKTFTKERELVFELELDADTSITAAACLHMGRNCISNFIEEASFRNTVEQITAQVEVHNVKTYPCMCQPYGIEDPEDDVHSDSEIRTCEMCGRHYHVRCKTNLFKKLHVLAADEPDWAGEMVHHQLRGDYLDIAGRLPLVSLFKSKRLLTAAAARSNIKSAKIIADDETESEEENTADNGVESFGVPSSPAAMDVDKNDEVTSDRTIEATPPQASTNSCLPVVPRSADTNRPEVQGRD